MKERKKVRRSGGWYICSLCGRIFGTIEEKQRHVYDCIRKPKEVEDERVRKLQPELPFE